MIFRTFLEAEEESAAAACGWAGGWVGGRRRRFG